MRYLQTVRGPIAANEIGITSCHEHVFCDNRCYSGDAWKKPENDWLTQPVRMEDLGRIRYHIHQHLDNAVLNDPVLAEEELAYWRASGGASIIDCTDIGIDRRPRQLKEISEKTGVNVIMGTGAYLEIAMPREIREADEATLRELFIRELRQGVDDTGIRCGFVGEIGISERFTEAEHRCLRAGAQAAAETGTVLLIHQPGLERRNLEILDIIRAEGLPEERVVLSHNDVFWDDPDYLTRALERGANLTFDTFGLEMVLNWSIPFPRDWDRLATVKELIRRGFGKQLLFGQDTCFKIQYRRFGGCGYAHLLNEILPLALAMGYSRSWLDDILIHNPARVFPALR